MEATLASPTVAAPITFTSQAIAAIKRIRTEEGLTEGHALRVGVKGGGCSGMSYVLGFDEVTANDDTYQIEGVTLAVDKRHLLYIANMEVDYQDGLNARGFVFGNPNAKSTCGCGTSFSA